ncbi:C39 family peptidase [Massilia sp. CMS3.1]|uniref:C39 family peptidase n=1 Tax=Massilia sp. CMS3.1 TaxID=3373083 RepID=UPI003EE801BF
MSRQNSVALIMELQNEKYWCWAAVAQSINSFSNGHSPTQAEIATNHTKKDCLASVVPDSYVGCPVEGKCFGSCNSPHRLSAVLADEGHAVEAIPLENKIDFEEIVDVIDIGKPLPLRINFEEGGHFLCVIGYADDENGNKFVQLLDPLFPRMGHGHATTRTIPFEQLAVKYSLHRETGSPNFKYQLG